MISCKQCGEPCGVGAELCRRCEEFNKVHPLAPGARRWCGRGSVPQNLPRPVGMHPALGAGYGEEPTADMARGTIVENLVQTTIADLYASALDDIATITGIDAPDFTGGGGGEFGGGGASGSW